MLEGASVDTVSRGRRQLNQDRVDDGRKVIDKLGQVGARICIDIGGRRRRWRSSFPLVAREVEASVQLERDVPYDSRMSEFDGSSKSLNGFEGDSAASVRSAQGDEERGEFDAGCFEEEEIDDDLSELGEIGCRFESAVDGAGDSNGKELIEGLCFRSTSTDEQANRGRTFRNASSTS